MKKVSAVFSLIIGVILFSGVSAVWAGTKTIEWRYNSVLPESRMEAKGTVSWANRVYEKSGHALKINVFPGNSLGVKPTDVLRVLKAGHVDSSDVFGAYVARDEPAFGAIFAQGVWKEPTDVRKIIEPLTEAKKRLLQKWGIELAGQQRVFINWIYVFSKEPIRSLTDMKGKKIRVWSKDLVKSLGKLGVAAQIIPQAELYQSLKTGVVDGALYAPGIASSISLYEVTKYASRFFVFCDEMLNHAVSTAAWEKLPVDLKNVVLEAGDWILEKTVSEYSTEEPFEEAIKLLEEKGVTFLKPFSEADRKTLQSTAFQVWEEMSENAGPEAVDNYKRLKEALLK